VLVLLRREISLLDRNGGAASAVYATLDPIRGRLLRVCGGDDQSDGTRKTMRFSNADLRVHLGSPDSRDTRGLGERLVQSALMSSLGPRIRLPQVNSTSKCHVTANPVLSVRPSSPISSHATKYLCGGLSAGI